MDGGKGFVIADIPGLIEGASEGVGLGHEFLRHIERTKVIIHMVDAASTQGRNPVADIKAINDELRAYNPELLKRPQVIAANKIDAIYDDGGDNPIDIIKKEFEPEGIKVYPIYTVTGKGLFKCSYFVIYITYLIEMDDKTVMKKKELIPIHYLIIQMKHFTLKKMQKVYILYMVPRVDRMLGYTNLK